MIKDNSEGSLTEEEKQIIVGCLLGDATMRKKTNSLIEINHSFKQKVLVDHLYKLLERFVLTPPKTRNGKEGRIAYRFTTRSLSIFNNFFTSFFPIKKKQIPLDLLLTPISLAYWIMDDGSKSRSSIYLNTQKYDLNDQLMLLKKLKEMGISATLNKDKIYQRIRISTKSIQKIKNMVLPYILPEFLYKLP